MSITDAPRLRRLDRWLIRFENFLNATAALGIFALMITATVQVLGRKLFNMPIPGYIDFAEQSIALFAFLGAAYCQRLNGHVRMELLISRFRGRLLWIIEAFAILIALILFAVLIKAGFDHFWRAYDIGDSTIDIQLPVWPSKLIVPIAFSVLWLRLLVQWLGYWRLIRYPDAEPLLVPVIDDIATQASREVPDKDPSPPPVTRERKIAR